MNLVQEIKTKVEENKSDIIQFLRDICAIPSMDSQIGPVGERIQAEMIKLGYEEVRFDKMGNTFGRIGSGRGFCSMIRISIRSASAISAIGTGIHSSAK